MDQPLLHHGAGVQAMLQFGLDEGLSVSRCLAGTGLASQRADLAQQLVTVAQELRVAGNLLEALGDAPALGVRVGLSQRLISRGVWAFAILSCDSLRAAIRLALAHREFWNPITRLEVTAQGEHLTGEISCEPGIPAELQAFLVERQLGVSRSFLRDLLGKPPASIRMQLCRPPPVDVAPYREIFGITPSFGAATNRHVTRMGDLLDRPLPGANTELARQCLAQCRALVEGRRAQAGLAGRTRDALMVRPGPMPDMEAVAAGFHLTSRTLRRRLEEEGTSFRQLQEEVRELLAEQLLADGLSVEDAAEALGYGEASCFIRAYRRWKGVTPHQDRKRLR